jgi:hypothetical protein
VRLHNRFYEHLKPFALDRIKNRVDGPVGGCPDWLGFWIIMPDALTGSRQAMG